MSLQATFAPLALGTDDNVLETLTAALEAERSQEYGRVFELWLALIAQYDAHPAPVLVAARALVPTARAPETLWELWAR